MTDWAHVWSTIKQWCGTISLWLDALPSSWGTIPQWVTAGIALGGAVIAILSITIQRKIARKRATMDFFLKASMDKECLQTYEIFKVQIRRFKAKNFDFKEYIGTNCPGYQSVRVWLNICELIAVGINRKVFDDRVAFDCWSGMLPWCYQECEVLIKEYRAEEGSELSYIDLQSICKRWNKPSIRKYYANKAKRRAAQRAGTRL